MQIIGHGIDLVSISGIKEQIDSPDKNWVDRFCSDQERAQANDPPVHYRYFAGRFAAKEAVAKALGTGFAGDISWRGIEILHKGDGSPYVRLSDDVEAFAQARCIKEWSISITYSGDLAMASAIAVGS